MITPHLPLIAPAVTPKVEDSTHSLQKHSSVIVRGGPVKDLPGMKYTLVRGKFDLVYLANRRQKRSKYGTKLKSVAGVGISRYWRRKL